MLLNRPPRDYDIITTGDPMDAATQIAARTGGRVVRLGKPGMYLYRVASGRIACDVTAAGQGSILSDLMARDFTVNAMAISTAGGELIDPANGRRDLDDKVIHMISGQNLISDPIRFLRAWRLAAELKFSISPETRDAIRAGGHLIFKSAGERIRDELIRFFDASGSADYIHDLAGTRMLSAIFPGIVHLKKCTQNAYHDFDVFDHTLKTYAGLETILNRPASAGLFNMRIMNFISARENLRLLKCAALLHDIGKPSSRSMDDAGRVHFYGHEQIGADMAGDICRHLRFSNHQTRYVETIIRHHLRPLLLFTAHQKGRLSQRAINRFFMKTNPYSIDILLLASADALAKGSGSNSKEFINFAGAMINFYIDIFHPMTEKPLLITGHDVINEFSLQPSKLIGEIMYYIKEQHLISPMKSRSDALDRIKNFLKDRSCS